MADGMATLSGSGLLVALYQRLVRDLDDAVRAIEHDAPNEAHHALVHAQDIVSELSLALDSGSWDGAAALAELYEWLYRQLVAANVAKDLQLVDACRSVVAPLADAWSDAMTVAAQSAPQAQAS
jgi:flagellar protein FliS